MPTREQMWNRLGEPVDVLVVGGGITGVCVARDAVMRGLKVALVEARDFAFGTSSRSSKLVHGGLRYLEQYEFSLVFEAVSERRTLLDIAPHLVKPLGFLFPVYKGSRHKLWFINAGMWVYDSLSLFRSPKIHRKLNPKAIAEEEPAVNQDGLTGAPLYYDCATDDARLTLEVALDAAQRGATVASGARLRSLIRDESGRITGAVVEDIVTGALKEIQAKSVVNCTGPWSDRVLAMNDGPQGTAPLIRPTKGIHIVVSATKLPVRNAVVCFHPKDGRVLFTIPWGDCTYVGTTDTDWQGDPSKVYADGDDVDYLIEAANAYFPNHQIARDDVLSTWAGLRPLIRPADENVGESAVSREHSILVGRDGLITIAGGKLTTARRMAAELTDTAIKLLKLQGQLPSGVAGCTTDREPLPGAVGWPQDDDADAVAASIAEAGGGAISAETARLFADTYGMRGHDVARLAASDPTLAAPLIPGRPEILAQVDWAATEEMAMTVADVLLRRTQVYYRHPSQGLDAAEVVGRRLGAKLGWTEAQIAASIQDYRDEVEASRAWR